MEPTALVPASPTVMAVFGTPRRLSVRQRKRWSEILTGMDAKNVYVVYDETGNPAFNVEEQGRGLGAVLKRLVLRSARPFESHVEDLRTNQPILTLKRPFRFIYHRLEVRDATGTLIGAIQRTWTWFRREYVIEGPTGETVGYLKGPFFRPWTFNITLAEAPDVPAGVLQKKWSGLGKEMFTAADNFWVELDQVPDAGRRALLFAATVLIDVVHFENR